jgi:glycosyltransferase involved in cell wall biosynthesis
MSSSTGTGLGMSDSRALRIVGVVAADAVHTHKWANWLVARGHRLQLLPYAPYAETGLRGLGSGVDLEPWFLPGFHIKRFWITLQAARRLRALVTEFAADLVHAHFLGHGAWYASVAGGCPLVVSLMGGGDMDPVAPRPRMATVLSRFALHRASGVVCWSKALREPAQDSLRPGTLCEVIVGGVDRSLFAARSTRLQDRGRFGVAADDVVVLSPRLLWPRSNIDVIVRAIAIVARTLPAIRLLLVRYRADDAPEYATGIERLIADLGLRSHVLFLPAVSNEEMPALLSAADCTVSIPVNDGTPMSVVESIACGTPVVAQDQPSLDPAVFRQNETVLRVPPRDPEAVANAILRVVTDRVLRDRLRENGRRILPSFDYDHEMQRLERVYDAIVRQNPRSGEVDH